MARAARTRPTDACPCPGLRLSLWWTHVVSLHRKSRTLHRELKDAEAALGSEPSEENLAWLRDVQGRLAALEGSEALIDGFGTLSGRPVRTF